jgi:hypothetical protein
LEDTPLPPVCRAPNGTPGCGPAVYASNLIRHAVEALHREHRFDLIVFPSGGAAGFRAVQAKRAGTAFADARLVVRLDRLSRWEREADKRWPTTDDLFLDYCERYTFENADGQAVASDYLLDYARRLGWAIRPDAAPLSPATAPVEVVFVGAPGPEALALFLDAVEGLDLNTPAAVLTPAHARRVGEAVASRLRGRTVVVKGGLTRGRQLAYLLAGRRLAVVCARSEVPTPEVRDCVAAGIPFVAMRPRWLPGEVTDADGSGRWFCRPDAADLRRLLRERLAQDAAPLACGDVSRWEDSPRVPAPAAVHPSPAATVAVSHYNLGRYLSETLASLAAQTWADLEVLVIDDGSTCQESRRVLDEQERLYPQFRFIRQENAGLGAVRNRALREARGEFFIPVDADNIAAPEMVERFVGGMRRRPDAAALTCFFLAFEDVRDLARGKFLYQYCPTGGPHVAACAFNVYGDANAVFRVNDLRAVGGFEADRATYCHDWETFVKLAASGRRADVLPEYLFYYRRRRDGMSAVMTAAGADLFPFAQRMLTNFFVRPKTQAEVEPDLLWSALVGHFLRDGTAAAAPPPRPGFVRAAARRFAAAGRAVCGSAARLCRALRFSLTGDGWRSSDSPGLGRRRRLRLLPDPGPDLLRHQTKAGGK